MTIKFDSEKKIIRTCTAPFQFVGDDDKLQTEEITVEYYSLTTKKLKEMRAAAEKRYQEKPDDPQWFSEILVDRIHALPDLVDKKGKPFAITAEFLDTIDLKNLEAIRKAIEGDLAPKSPSPTS